MAQAASAAVVRAKAGFVWRLVRFWTPVYLVWDYFYTDSDMMQRRRIREKLELACARPPAFREPRQPSNSPRLPTAGPTPADLLSGGAPIAISGPAGCGKSRFLEDAAAALAAPPAKGSAEGGLFANATDDDPARPVIHLRLCKPPGPVMDEQPGFGKYEVARLQADLLADAVLTELGVPVRPCALRLLSARTACFLTGEMPSQWIEARLSRVEDALRILYEEADQLSRERRAERIPADRAAPVIMIDNADAFVGSAALAMRGGSRVFASLLTLAHWYQGAASGRDVKTILAGSPVLHVRPELTAASRDQSQPVARIYQLGDPDVPSALKALQGAGHSREMAENIVAALGTRVGLLQPHLDPSQPHDAAAARTVLQQQLKDIEVQLQRL